MFVHWLGVGGISIKLLDEHKQWCAIKEYVDSHPNSKITIYNKCAGRDLFERIVKLECKQSYKDLELDCNSGFNYSLRKLFYKPKELKIVVWGLMILLQWNSSLLVRIKT